MNDAEYKQIEGSRVQQVLSAIGALPAAILVFGGSPAVGAPGAPLFAVGVIAIVGALMNWNYTDSAYHMDTIERAVPLEHDHDLKAFEQALHAFAMRVYYRTYIYGAVSLFCSIVGLAAVYSTLRSPISVEHGFGLTVGFAILTVWDVVRLGNQRNALLAASRRLSLL